jgi:ricin-type beta-trefoil lectin protein/LGFP repeat-containing protein
VIYWHATTGAHVMTAPITQKWRELGAEKSWLGYPTVDQGPLPKGLRTVFQNGRIDSSNDGGGTMAYKTTTVTPRAIEIKGVQSGRCIQVAGVGQDALNNGGGTELWGCVAGAKQIWDVVSLGNNKYNLKNRNSGKCLDISGGSVANGVSLIQNACNTSTWQQWEFTTTADASLALRNVNTGKVAEARNDGTPNATLITRVADSGLSHQRWTLVTIN